MFPNIKLAVALLLLFISLASEGQGREIVKKAVDVEVQEREIDKRAVDELTCVWNAVKSHLPSTPAGQACVVAGDAVSAVANTDCVKRAVDTVLDGLLNNLKNFFQNKCSLTLSKIKGFINEGSNDAYYVKANVPTVLLMAVGGILATRRYIL